MTVYVVVPMLPVSGKPGVHEVFTERSVAEAYVAAIQAQFKLEQPDRVIFERQLLDTHYVLQERTTV